MLTLSLMALAVGAFISLHMSMNAQTGVLLGDARLANVFFWLFGLIAAVLLALPRQDYSLLRRLGGIPPWLLLAGALGACIALFASIAIPKLGAANLTVLLLAGQLLASSALSAAGALGSPRTPLSLVKLAGLVLMLAGTALALYADRINPSR
ncbi:MAG: DMT family transporter [Spirochaetes bacterium]|nr:DMT family transporter [Spirochaetota bacterium]MBU0956209.1 DMT family transporter [Spirochaetota bacterium]